MKNRQNLVDRLDEDESKDMDQNEMKKYEIKNI